MDPRVVSDIRLVPYILAVSEGSQVFLRVPQKVRHCYYELTLKKPAAPDTYALRVDCDLAGFLNPIKTSEHRQVTQSSHWRNMDYYSIIQVHPTTGIVAVEIPELVCDSDDQEGVASANKNPNAQKTFDIDVSKLATGTAGPSDTHLSVPSSVLSDMLTQIRLLREDLAVTKKQVAQKTAQNCAPSLSASQVNNSIAAALEHTVNAKDNNRRQTDLSHVPQQFSDILSYNSKPSANKNLSDDNVRNLAKAYANLQNIDNTLAKMSAQSSTGLPPFVVAPPTITVPCGHLFGKEFVDSANDILLRASRDLSDLVTGRLQTLHDTIRNEYDAILSDWTPDQSELAAVIAIVQQRVRPINLVQDRPSIGTIEFLTLPEAGSKQTMITPNRAIINYHSTGTRTSRFTGEPTQYLRDRSGSRPRSRNEDRMEEDRPHRDQSSDRRDSRPRGRGYRTQRGLVRGTSNGTYGFSTRTFTANTRRDDQQRVAFNMQPVFQDPHDRDDLE